ncbi:MAG: PmoA family protein [Lentisphaerales bacterium]|nr:PmoA family protein [Lentisphaerales bacterium]
MQLKDGQRSLLTYNAGYTSSPFPDKPFYGRSGYIHPLYSPSGKTITAEFPKSHPHQHALMFAWTSAVIEGRKVDFWNSHKKQGRVEHVETISASADKILVKLQYIDLTAGKETPVINETWEITRIPHEELNIFDLKSTQSCISQTPVKIGKYHYGGMCIRANDTWVNKVDISTDQGLNRQAANNSRPKWIAMSGLIDGAICGVAAIGHPSNFRSPQPIRVHPKKPYFCFAPMILGDFEIKKDQAYISTFRIVTFDGKLNEEQLNTVYKNFASKY